ncbi:MAG: hypothetical protein GF311_04815 [Candidatus Lokiarchaeota archaeon]|nr:hypothetical protein [Candidatus Lokiarchaeota archaeon]
MKKLNYQLIIGMLFLGIDSILCFTMLYLGHLGFWQFIDDPFAVYFFSAISVIFGIGMGFIIWALFSRKFQISI